METGVCMRVMRGDGLESCGCVLGILVLCWGYLVDTDVLWHSDWSYDDTATFCMSSDIYDRVMKVSQMNPTC